MPDEFRRSMDVEPISVTAEPGAQPGPVPPALSGGEEGGTCTVVVVDTDSEFMTLEPAWDRLVATADVFDLPDVRMDQHLVEILRSRRQAQLPGV